MEFITNVIWALVTIKRADRLLENLPEDWFPVAVPTGILISSVCGKIVKEERRWPWIQLPRKVVMLASFQVFACYLWEMNNSVGLSLVKQLEFFNLHCGFWLLLLTRATDISQVLLPMLLLVRPYHFMVVVLSLLFY